MSVLIASDIHGSVPALQRILDFYDRGGYTTLLLLGDYLNYGPRNGLPEGLDAPTVVSLLNERADSIIAVRGNCDSEVDQMLFDFDMMGTYAVYARTAPDGREQRFFLTHGHVFNDLILPTGRYDVMLFGHTHRQLIAPAVRRVGARRDGEEDKGEAQRPMLLVNPGSPTFPKGGNPPTFATIDGDSVSIRTLDGSAIHTHEL